MRRILVHTRLIITQINIFIMVEKICTYDEVVLGHVDIGPPLNNNIIRTHNILHCSRFHGLNISCCSIKRI